MAKASQHGWNTDNGRCNCGGQVVYFDVMYGMEHPNRSVGDGCEIAGQPFDPIYLVGSIVEVELLPGKPHIVAEITGTYVDDTYGEAWHFVTGIDGQDWEIPAKDIVGIATN